MTKVRYDLNPSLPVKIFRLLTEQLYCAWLMLLGAIPFIQSLISTAFTSYDKRLPTNIPDLLDTATFSRMTGRTDVENLEYSVQLEQHANSTDRAWIKFRNTTTGEEEFVFAKVQSKQMFVRTMMCCFDV